MPRFLRWSRCAVAILLAFQAYPSASFGQGRWVANSNSPSAMPVRVAQISAPATPPEAANFGTMLASDESGGSYSISDGGSDYSGGNYDGCSNGYDGGCNGSCGPNGGYCSGGCPPDYGCNTGCNSCQRCGPRVSLFADYLYLQTTGADVTHAQQQNGAPPPGAGQAPFGEIGTIGMDFQSGYRVGGEIFCTPCSSVVTSFSSFEAKNDESLDEPVIPGGGGALVSLVEHPGAGITASIGPVTTTYDVEFKVGDILFRHQFLGGSCYTTNFLIGAQFGHLEQDFTQLGSFSGGFAGVPLTTTSVNFDGGGLKAGFDTERQICRCISIYGRCTAAAMQGEFQGLYTESNVNGNQLLAQAQWTDNRIVGQLEYEAGFDWKFCHDHWHISAGYLMSQWFNTVTTSDFIDAVQKNNYTNVGDTISFGGLVTRIGCYW